MRFKIILLAAILFQTQIIAGSHNSLLQGTGRQIWKIPATAGYFDSSPAIGDVDADGIRDIVLATTAGRVFAFDAQSRVIWWYDTGAVISTPPTIIQSNEDQATGVIVLTNRGRVICIDGAFGIFRWEYQLPGNVNWGSTAVVAANISGDAAEEIIAVDSQGHLVCLNQQGKVIWKNHRLKSADSAPAVGDLDGDGKCEILISSKKIPLTCFSNRGKRLWQYREKLTHKRLSKHYAGSSPLIWDIDQDGRPEILLGVRDRFTVLSASGKMRWHFEMKSDIHDAVSIGDVDNDGELEIIVVDLAGNVVCLTPQGRAKWEANVQERVRRSATLGDVDRDGTIEILVAGYSRAIHVFDPKGQLEQCLKLSSSINASPVIADLMNDGNLTVVCLTDFEINAFQWDNPAPVPNPQILWPEYRFNAARTAAPVAEKPDNNLARFEQINYGNLFAGQNEFQVSVINPGQQKLQLDLKIIRNDVELGSTTISSTEKKIIGKIPYRLFGKQTVRLQFICQLKNAAGKILKQQQHTIQVAPFLHDLAQLDHTLQEIKELFAQTEYSGQMENQLQHLRGQIEEYREQVFQRKAATGAVRRKLRDDLAYTRGEMNRMAALLKAKQNAGSTLAAYPANPWAPFGGVDEITENRLSGAEIVIEAFSGEKESAAINLANFGDQPMTVRIEAQPVYSADGTNFFPARQVLDFHEVIQVPSQMRILSADALPKLGQAGTMLLPGWNVRQLWIQIDASKLPPGEWTAPILVRSLQAESQEVAINLKIKVWETALPAEQPLKLCHWGYVYRSKLGDQPEAALADQVAHGTNVFVATSLYAPKARFDSTGALIGELDFTAHDEYVQQHAPHGIILFFNYQTSLSGPAALFSPEWTKAYSTWLRLWTEHLLALGITYNDFAFYPIDEPGLHEGLVDKFINFSKPIRKLNPEIQIYTDPVKGASLAALKQMAPYVDIWCPNRIGYLLDQGQEKTDFIKSTGKTVWTYECQGNAKHQSPLGYYRAQAWLAWQHGLTGIGFWSYCTSAYDPWYIPEGGQDYLLIYQGDGVVSSKRWEAIRDGIEDYSLLVQLRKALEHSAKNKKTASIAAARKLLSDEAAKIAQFCGIDSDGTLPAVNGLAATRKIADKRRLKIQTVRRKIAALLQEFHSIDH